MTQCNPCLQKSKRSPIYSNKGHTQLCITSYTKECGRTWSLDLTTEKQIDSMYAKIQITGNLRYTKIFVGFIPPTKLNTCTKH